jgi:hypothetical protein
MKNLIRSWLASFLAACDQESQAREVDGRGDGDQDRRRGRQGERCDLEGDAEFRNRRRNPREDRPQIEQLRAKAKSASESARSEMNEALAGLDGQRKALADKMSELKTAAPEKANALLESLKSSLATLKKSTEDAAKRFQ